MPMGLSPHPPSRAENFNRAFDNLDSVFSPVKRSGYTSPLSQYGFGINCEPNPMIAEAWDNLRRSLVYFRGEPVGTIAALDNSDEKLNYDQVFVRDFVPSALAFLMNGEPEIVKNFILKTLRLQSWEKKIDRFQLGEGVMPASFKVLHDPSRNTETFGVYGYPIEIQTLFFMALRCAMVLLKHDAQGKEFLERIVKRLHALSYHMRSYFWLDMKQLNDIYRFKTEEYSHTAVNKFNVMPDSLPEWIFDFMPMLGGYFIGNVGPSKMDFRWFSLGNCIAILSSLATHEQATAIMDLIEARWEELVGDMPLKVCYPAIESHEWRIVTGCDPKNTRWSYHNGGSWPVLLWLLTAACIKTGRPQIARRAIELIESRLSKDGWPEYYDGKLGRYIGKQARKYQTWSIAGYLVAKMMIEDPSHLGMIALEEDKHLKQPVLRRSASWTT
ncbi:beta-fructofuranosidase [Dorcoceras hygrometricum]|uniref:Alkaline/neutral invertase n=1 Tax=Dorcoceras hygrometricum TaxID=472368 RepID=A0A2Z7D887_9LAMI|nr:beta-fructofuranosidase [Dorcoceras hygrometricum]